jgi:hypothetical protein
MNVFLVSFDFVNFAEIQSNLSDLDTFREYAMSVPEPTV